MLVIFIVGLSFTHSPSRLFYCSNPFQQIKLCDYAKILAKNSQKHPFQIIKLIPSFLSGTSGLTCGTVEQASFSGSGALELPPLAAYIVNTGLAGRRRRAIAQMLVTFKFVTTIPSGVLMYNEGVSL